MVSSRCRRLLAGLALIVLAGALSPAAAGGRNKISELYARMRSLAREMATKRQQIAATAARQEQAAGELGAAQQRLDTARADLNASRDRLEAARDAVEAAEERLEEARRRLKVQQSRFGSRIAASYVQGPVGYADVLLGARDFNDFLDREFYIGKMMEQDAEILRALRQAQQEVAREHAALVSHERAAAAAHVEIESREETFAERAREQRELLERIKDQRDHQEEQLEDLEEDSRAVGQLIRRELARRGRRRQQTGRSSVPLPQWSGRYRFPVKGRITSGFGYRVHPILKRRKFHTGLDIGAAYGSPIYAAAGGEVFHAGLFGGYGQCIIILHGGGVSTLYGHCSSLAVSPGQHVSRGQIIGYVGSTGLSTGPHLHFEVRARNGTPVNPR